MRGVSGEPVASPVSTMNFPLNPKLSEFGGAECLQPQQMLAFIVHHATTVDTVTSIDNRQRSRTGRHRSAIARTTVGHAGSSTRVPIRVAPNSARGLS